MAFRVQDLLKPVDDASAVALPPGFADALTEVRAAITRCRKAALPENTVLAALLTELMPGLIHVHGSDRVAVMLRCLADEIAIAGVPQSIADSGTSN
jgi:hypothetical protein